MSNSHESKTRSKLITLIFIERGLIEKYGSGIDRIKHLWKANGLKEPLFEEVQKGFRVTLYKETSQGASGKGINSLYEHIKHNPSKVVSQIQVQLNTPAKTLERWVKQLRDLGKIENRGSKKTGGYHVK